MSSPLLRSIADLLQRYRYRYTSETQLQDRLASVLDAHGIAYEREYAADAANRFDFLLQGGLVVEVKVKGTIAEALRQVDRYQRLHLVTGVILAGTPRWAAESLPDRPEWAGKGFAMVKLERQSL
ncbi:hypothetical protein BJP27_24380 (plasmid) [Pseudomonas oryzihabitans]|nr:hypothetical protein BJP27_24380 [Pseudomonas psychrotolerans]